MDWEKLDNLLGEVYSRALALQGLARLLRAGEVAQEKLTQGQVKNMEKRAREDMEKLKEALDAVGTVLEG